MPYWFNAKRVILLTGSGILILLWLYLIFIRASIYVILGGLFVTALLIFLMFLPSLINFIKEEKEFKEQERRSVERHNQEQGELNDLNKWNKK